MNPMTPEEIDLLATQGASALSDVPAATEQPSAAPKPAELPAVMKVDPTQAHDVKLPNGMTVTIQKPSGPVSFKLARMMGHQSANPALEMYYKTFLWIRKIDLLVIKEDQLTTHGAMDMVLNTIGDDGLEMLLMEVTKRENGLETLDLSLLGKS